MIVAHKFDSNGKWLPGEEIRMPDDSGEYVLPEGYTFKELPKPNWKPVFQNGEWVETDQASYDNWIATKDLPVEIPKTEIDILKEELAASKEETATMNLAIIELWEMLT